MAPAVSDPDLISALEAKSGKPVNDPDIISALESKAAPSQIPEKTAAPSGLSEEEFMRWVEKQGQNGKVINGTYHSPITDEDYSRYSKIKAGRARGAEAYQNESAATHFARSYAQGGTVGWEPQLAGTAAKYLYGYDPTEVAAEERQKAAQYGADHPTASFIGKMAGGIPTIAAGGEITSGIPYVGPAISNALSSIPNPFLRASATAGIGGLPIGISEATSEHGLSPTDMAIGGAIGVGEGLVGGPLIHGLIRGGQGLYRLAADAIDPHAAAIRKLTEELGPTGVTPDQIRTRVMPQTSAQLRARGFTDEIMTDIVSRGLAGEPATQIAADYAHLRDAQGRSLTGATVRGYVDEYRDMHPTPLNMVDVTKQIAGEGNAQPITDFARAAQGISKNPEAAQRLTGRQLEQPARAVQIVERASPGAGNFEATLDRLNAQAQAEANVNYGTLHAQPDVIVPDDSDLGRLMSQPLARSQWEEARMLAQSEGVDIPTSEELALLTGTRPRGGIGLTEEGTIEPPTQIPAAPPPAQNAVAIPVRALDYFQRALRHNADSAFGSENGGTRGTAMNNIRQRLIDILDPVTPTPGRGTLVPGFRATMGAYRTGRAGPEAMEAGRSMVRNLGSANTRETLRDFRRMTPAQQDLFRIGFGENLQTAVGNKQFGTNAVAQFNSPNTQEMIRAIYPEQTAERLIRELGEERISTETMQDIMKGSRTAPMANDMENMMQAAHAVADIATMNPLGLWKQVGNRLAYHIGRRQAGAISDVATEQRPANMLRNLNEMSGIAPTLRQQQENMSTASRLGGQAAADAYDYGDDRRVTSTMAKPSTVRQLKDQIAPGARLRYSPEAGGLVLDQGR